MKIHAIKSLNSLERGIPELVEDIIDILETLSMNYLPCKVKMFVKNFVIIAHQYKQRTLIGASDSMLGFRGKEHFSNMCINNYQLNPEWEGWISRQQKMNLNLLLPRTHLLTTGTMGMTTTVYPVHYSVGSDQGYKNNSWRQ